MVVPHSQSINVDIFQSGQIPYGSVSIDDTDDNYDDTKMMITLLMATKEEECKQRANWLGWPTA